ncbi:hypothetical protein M231_03834 [Tremella mesenterica]|uniref:DUF1445 domain-containing protein n=1 Tax=Tremella mesenterica TaxID=5217 RepID=A0A4Q1BM47_TREME|nr:uncharacterized protein TREMEDRAFT_41658 [Tremella mesenterica DSM 1558]EIW72330.1 hypothetical protein TREMEDRAFT_41658 [Tremella mesenterica DSM 1558]RXK38885.1 hypothetical protein M231_03834 [Tremella mesenterica]
MPFIHDQPDPSLTPAQVRQLCRENKLPTPQTSGYAPGYAQANIVVLPLKYADDFRTFCQRNPVPCPLLGETAPGDPTVPSHLAKGSDIRTDCARYNIYEDGKRIANKTDIIDEWQPDSVAFFIGCSYSFEDALIKGGFGLRHQELNNMTPCYRTSVPLMRSGPIKGKMVVSMRPYPLEKVPEIVRITKPYARTHGEPVGWGPEGAKELGIEDVNGQKPTWGDPTVLKEGEVCVYWGCGVSPQQAVMDSELPGVYMSHEPGQMLVLDLKIEDVCQ